MFDGLTERQRRLIDAALVLAVIALGFVVLGYVASVFYAFGDILLLFFLAWLLSFALLPLINGLVAAGPAADQAGAVIVVYLTIVVVLLRDPGPGVRDPRLVDQPVHPGRARTSRTSSRTSSPSSRSASPAFGLPGRPRRPGPADRGEPPALGVELVGPLQSVAVASIGVFGNILILVILSIYIAVDRDEIVAFLYRLVPPGYVTEARLLQTSVSKSFGGFLRGQVVMGLFFGLLTALVNIVFGLPYAAVTTVAAGLLQMIPFFGPFVSWLPPVAVALLLKPDVALPVLDRDGHRVVRDDEHHLAAADVGLRRHPPDRRPRVGRHRRQDRGHRRRDLRHPDRRRAVRVLLPLVRPVARGRHGRRPGDETGGRTRGPRGQTATRAGARGSTRTWTRSAAPRAADDGVREAVAEPSPAAPACERATRARSEAEAEHPGHDPGARAVRAAGPRHGARRAGRRARGAASGRFKRVRARPLGDWTTRPRILVTNDDGIESPRHPRAQAGARPDRRRDGRRAGHEPVGGRPPEDADAAAARPGADARRRLDGLLGRRLADRLRQPRVPRLLRGALRPRRVGHQLRREPGRRHHVLGDGVARRWRR